MKRVQRSDYIVVCQLLLNCQTALASVGQHLNSPWNASCYIPVPLTDVNPTAQEKKQ